MKIKRIVFTLCLALLIGAPIISYSQAEMKTGEVITFSTTAVGFSAATLKFGDGRVVTECFGKLEQAAIREYHNGTTPTSSDGTPIAVGETLTLSGATNIKQFKGIRSGDTDGIIRFQCGAW